MSAQRDNPSEQSDSWLDSWLTMFEMTLAGIYERVEREDGSEDWEPRMDISRDEFDSRLHVFLLGKRWSDCIDNADGLNDVT